MSLMGQGASDKMIRDSSKEAERFRRASPIPGLGKYKLLHLDLSGTTVDEELDAVDEAGIA